jgi:hypothetical protein
VIIKLTFNFIYLFVHFFDMFVKSIKVFLYFCIYLQTSVLNIDMELFSPVIVFVNSLSELVNPLFTNFLSLHEETLIDAELDELIDLLQSNHSRLLHHLFSYQNILFCFCTLALIITFKEMVIKS